MNTETFKFDPAARTVLRESDGEIMATVDAAGVVSFTHPSRERNYGADIRNLLETAGITAPEQQPPPSSSDTPPATPPPAAPSQEPAPAAPPPPADPSLGSYTHRHLLWDFLNTSDEAFAAKWGGRMAKSTRSTVQAKRDSLGGHADAILARIS